VVDRRHRHFAVAVLVLLVGGVAIAVATHGESAPAGLGRYRHRDPKPGPARKPDSTVVDGPRALASRFVAIYLHYERGELNSHIRVALSRLCAEPFRSELLDQPARVPPAARPPVQRVRQALEPSPNLVAGAAGMAVPVALANRGGGKPRLVVDMRVTPRGWRVEGIER
jgi:hypothetical protein